MFHSNEVLAFATIVTLAFVTVAVIMALSG